MSGLLGNSGGWVGLAYTSRQCPPLKSRQWSAAKVTRVGGWAPGQSSPPSRRTNGGLFTNNPRACLKRRVHGRFRSKIMEIRMSVLLYRRFLARVARLREFEIEFVHPPRVMEIISSIGSDNHPARVFDGLPLRLAGCLV